MAEELRKFVIEKTKPDTWLNDLDQVVSGYQITVRLTEFDELHTVQVSDLEENTVKPVIEKLVKDRENIANLG